MDSSSDAERINSFFRFLILEWMREPPIRELTARDGLNESGHVILHRLQRRGPMSLSAVARDLGLDASTVSRQIQRLRERGLIEPPKGTIGRTTELRVTAAGEALLSASNQMWMDHWQDILAAMNPGNCTTLADCLDDIQLRMNANLRTPVGR